MHRGHEPPIPCIYPKLLPCLFFGESCCDARFCMGSKKAAFIHVTAQKSQFRQCMICNHTEL